MPSTIVQSQIHEPDGKTRGVTEWLHLKQRALWVFFGEDVSPSEGGISSDLQLARAIAKCFPEDEQNPPDGTPLERKFTDAMGKWHRSAPGRRGRGGKKHSEAMRLMTAIIAQINQRLAGVGHSDRMTAYIFIHGSYAEFCAAFPQKWKSLFPHLKTNASTGDYETLSIDKAVYSSWRSRRMRFELVSAAVSRGLVDQRFYYRTPEAVANWEGVISAGNYPLFEWCKNSLTELTGKDVWKRFFSNDDGRGIVMLGAGGASKDLVLIRSALAYLSESDRLNYTIVDISPYMAHSTYQIVDANLRRDGLNERAKVTPMECDFMSLNDIASSVRPAGKRLAWFLPGSTIGNLNEHDFLMSVRGAMQKGDLLVIGAETLNPSAPKLVKKSTDHYKSPAVRDFLAPALMAIWHDLGTTKSVQELEKLIDVNPRLWPRNEHSRVPAATTIELSLQMKDRLPIVLLTSTKYDSAKFIQFVERAEFEFKKELVVESALAEQYKQFVFRFIPRSYS